jgi:hypothetical protein
VHDPVSADLELMVSPTYLDFIIHHPAFHPFPPRRWRPDRVRRLAAKIRGIAVNYLRSRQLSGGSAQ